MMKKAWISRDALHDGVKEVEGAELPNGVFRTKGGASYYFKGEWHADKFSAYEAAEHMRMTAVFKARTEIDRLLALDFTYKLEDGK
jgi:hypothetical protein